MSRIGSLGSHLLVAALVVWVLLPLVSLVVWSVSARWPFPTLLPVELSPRAWSLLLEAESDLGRALLTSLLLAVVVAVVATAIGLSAGRALGLHTFPGKRLVQGVLLAPLLVPPLAATMGIHVVLIRVGLADTVAGVALVHLLLAVPYTTLLMASVFATYDRRLEEQASVLGAGPLSTVWRITLPMVFPGVRVAALVAFLVSWGEYLLTVLIGGGQVKTLPLLLFASVEADPSLAAALTLVLVAPAMLLVGLLARSTSVVGRAPTSRGPLRPDPEVLSSPSPPSGRPLPADTAPVP